MSSRVTQIKEIEIKDYDEVRDEVFSIMSTVLLDEQRLIKRFYIFCDEFNNFEFDEMGLNIDESEEILNKSTKIRNLFVSNIQAKILFSLDNIKTDVKNIIITMIISHEEIEFKAKIEIMEDSFNLELL